MWLLPLVGCHLFASGEIDKVCEDLPGGCDGKFSADDTGGDHDPGQEITLSLVTPAYGHSSGGYSVIIDGSGLDDITTVLIGGGEAEILSQGPAYVEVNAPARPLGLSDVAVSSSDGTSARLTNAFEYFQDAEGAVQFLAAVSIYEGIGLDGRIESVDGLGKWIEDGDVWAWEAYGASQADFDSGLSGACGNYSGLPGIDREGVFSDMLLAGDSSSFSLLHTGGAAYELSSLDASDFPVNEVLGLLPYDFASSTVEGVDRFAFAPGLSLDRDLSFGGISQEITGDVEVRLLEPTNDEEHKIIVQGLIYDADTSALLAGINCVALDRGYFRVPEEDWSYDGEWPEGGIAVIALGRMRTQESVIPHTNGTARISISNYTVVRGIVGPLTE